MWTLSIEDDGLNIDMPGTAFVALDPDPTKDHDLLSVSSSTTRSNF